MKRMKNDPDMLEEYDFSGGIRGKYAMRYAEGTDVIVIAYISHRKLMNTTIINE